MIPELESSLDLVRKRARRNGFLRRLASWLAGSLVAAGAVALALRAFLDTDAQLAAWTLVLAPVVIVAAWVLARRSVPARENAVAWLDVESGGRGTLLAELELGDARWHHAVRSALDRTGVPESASPRGLATRSLPSLAFALVCLWVPIPEPEAPAQTTWFENRAEELREKLATLEEEITLDEDTAEELEQRLDNLEADIADGLPEAVFEGLDGLESRLEELALGARESAESAMEEAMAAAEEAEADPDGALAELESALDELADAGLNGDLIDALPPDLQELMQEAMEGAALEAGELGDLADGLSDFLDSKLMTLAEAGLLDSSELKKGKLAKLSEYEPHECDENCEPGGT